MSRKRQLCALVAFSLLLISGCAARGLHISDSWTCAGCEPTSCADPERLAIEYLGSGGYRLVYGSDVVLLAPFFSNIDLLGAASLRTIAPDTEAIDRWLPEVSTAAAILVGHAHYDHLLDVPWIAKNHAPEALIYGSETTAHILAADPELHGRVVTLNDQAFKRAGEEHWIAIPGTRIRFLAIVSEHAPHLGGIKFMQGYLEADLEELPRRASGWVQGLTLAFLIEFMDADGVTALFRIHYQDAASTPPYGFPPSGAGPVDVAITCVAGHSRVDGYPDELLRAVAPRHVLLGHWENFFKPYDRDPDRLRPVPFSNPKKFIRRVDMLVPLDGERTLPAPGSGIRLASCPEKMRSSRK